MCSGWDLHDTTYSRELLISNRANGYRDLIAKVDLSTYRRIPWEFNVPFFLVSFLDPDTREPVCADPRGTIIKAQNQAAEFGWHCFAGVEYEVSGPPSASALGKSEFFLSTFNSKVCVPNRLCLVY